MSSLKIRVEQSSRPQERFQDLPVMSVFRIRDGNTHLYLKIHFDDGINAICLSTGYPARCLSEQEVFPAEAALLTVVLNANDNIKG